MIDDIINMINQEFGKTFSAYQSIAIYGITELFTKTNKDNSTYTLPGIPDSKGEIKYVGIDDKYSLIIYHRLGVATQVEQSVSSYGDERSNIITTYNNSLFVYGDRKINCASQSNLLELIQTSLPDTLSISGYKNILTKINNANFNTKAIFNSEYSGASSQLKPEKMLIQLNYQIETTASKNCLKRCA